MFSQNRQGTWGPIPRKTSWMTRSPCRCRYGYGGLRMESLGTDGDVLKSYQKNINYRPWWCTTQKANIDIQNRHICKGVTFSKPSFSKILECKLWPPGRSCRKRTNCKSFNLYPYPSEKTWQSFRASLSIFMIIYVFQARGVNCIQISVFMCIWVNDGTWTLALVCPLVSSNDVPSVAGLCQKKTGKGWSLPGISICLSSEFVTFICSGFGGGVFNFKHHDEGVEMMVIHLLLWCLQGTDSKPCCHKSEVNKFIYMATNLRNAQQLLAFIDTEDIVSNNVFNWLYSRISLQLWISHPWISIFSASLDNQQPVSTAGFLTGKVFLFGCCEPLRSFRYIDSLSHLHLEIITIYMSTSIFMYTCHMFAGSFQNQGSILKKKIYIYYTSIFNVHTKR